MQDVIRHQHGCGVSEGSLIIPSQHSYSEFTHTSSLVFGYQHKFLAVRSTEPATSPTAGDQEVGQLLAAGADV